MDENKYREILSSFDRLGDYAIEISYRLAGIATEEHRLLYADTIFTKLISHAISLRKISPKLNSENSPELWDVSSASVVARALIESYEALAYISINDVTPNEREFRIKLWELHDLQRRIKMLTQIESKNSEMDTIKNKADLLHAELIQHTSFSDCSQDIRNKINNGDAPAFYLSQQKRNEISGINHKYHNTVTMVLSQYVHTLPMAIHQLMGFRTNKPESLLACSMPFRYSMAYLAKAISGMVVIFPEKVSKPSAETAKDMEFWLNVAENGVK